MEARVQDIQKTTEMITEGKGKDWEGREPVRGERSPLFSTAHRGGMRVAAGTEWLTR